MTKRVKSVKPSCCVNWRLRVVSLLLVPIQIFAVWPAHISLGAIIDQPEAGVLTSSGFPSAQPLDPTSHIKPNRTLPKVDAASKWHLSETPSDAELSALRVFQEPLIPVGAPTSASENQALAGAIRGFVEEGDAQGIDGLTNFLNQFPGSSWRASLLANLGAVWRLRGHWSKALDAWEEAWPLVARETGPEKKALGDYVLGELAQLNARLGRAERLKSLFAEINDRDIRGAATEKVAGARQGLALMRTRPQDAFRCGPMALKQILLGSGKATRKDEKTIIESASTEQGMSLLEVRNLATKLGMDYQMAKRSPGAEIIVPSVINWKVGHYAALTDARNGKFIAQDPTFGNGTLISQQTIDQEQSGYYLVARGQLPDGWQPVSETEGQSIWGKGNAGANSEPPPPGVAPSVRCPKESPGMADYNVDSARVSLSIMDTPVGYRPPRGPAVRFTVSYQQREIAPVQTPTYSNLGNKWSFNWISYIVIDPANQAADATAYGPGGGTLHYTGFNSGTQSYAPQRETQESLVKIGLDQYEKRFPDGSKQIFALSDGAPVSRKLFMTQSIDPLGNTLTYTYDGTFRVVAVTDAIGQVTTLSYELASDPLKVTKVVDPFARQAVLEYNGAGQLWKITDSIGLTSEFTYGSGDFISKMTTPYGETSFAMGETGDTYRWLEITDPQGAKERVEYKSVGTLPASDPANTVPVGILTLNNYLNYRNTAYWDKKAMAEAAGDYTKARITHWLHSDDINVASDIPESTKLPFENRVWNNYPGQTWPAGTGNSTSNKPSKVARVLDNGTTQLYQYEYNSFGKTTKMTDPLGRVTTYVYAANGIDLLTVYQRNPAGASLDPEGQHADKIAALTYNAQHEPLTTTGASGKTTVYVYYPNGQVHTITNAKNEATTFAYDASGYLQSITGPIAGAITQFAYDGFGRLRTTTDSEGYTITVDYDAIGGDSTKSMDRVAKVTYPDGTYEEITYDRLDPEWTRDRLGRWSQNFYDALRRLVVTQDPLYRITIYNWCNCGSLEGITDPNQNTTSWVRDVQGRVTDKMYSDQTSIHYTYETTTSRLKSTLDAKGQSTNYTYFLDNNLQQVSYTNAQIATPSVSYSYDPVYNRIASMADGTGTTGYSYNPVAVPPALGAGRLASVDGPLANDTITYSYDQLGRAISRSINGAANAASMVYDTLGRTQTATNPLGTFTYSYVNMTNRIDHLDIPSGQKMQYAYFDNLGDQRLKQIKNLNPSGGIISQFDYLYNPVGDITSWTVRQGGAATAATYTLGYDAADQQRSAMLKKVQGGTVLKQYDYDYDAAGNRYTNQDGSTITTASFNNLNQLTSQSGGGKMHFRGTVNEPSSVTVAGNSASVDGLGNFDGVADVVTGNNTVPVVATDTNNNVKTNNYQMTVSSGANRTLSYDLDGNLTGDGTKTYEWDAANRLLAINYTGTSNRTEFTYDGLSRKVKIIEKTGSTVTSAKTFVWAGLGIAEERNNSNKVTRKHYPQGVQFVSYNPTTTIPYFYMRDHLGSIREMTDSTGTIKARYDYDPWGNRTKLSGSLDADFGFTGHYYHSPSSLHLAPYRAYDSTIGRWISRDPLGEMAGFNFYSYVLNEPLNFVDPLGLDAALAWAIFGRAAARAGTAEALGLGPENPVADIAAAGLLAWGLYDALRALNENPEGKRQETSCPADGGATNPNTPDPDDPGGNLKKMSDNQLKNDGIDAHLLKRDFLGNQGGRYNISVDTNGNVQLTPVRPGSVPNVNTGFKYHELANLYPLG
jgi:RHS repeat-associated protein